MQKEVVDFEGGLEGQEEDSSRKHEGNEEADQEKNLEDVKEQDQVTFIHCN